MSAPDPDDDSGKQLSLFRRLAQSLRGRADSQAIRESLEEVIEESDRETGDLSPQERVMLANLLKFGELKISDVMVPRPDIVAVEEKTPIAELVKAFREAQHSRLPVYRETLDDPLGFFHIKDVLALAEQLPDGTLRWNGNSTHAILRNLVFVPPSMAARDLLLKMQSSHIHLALVIDEYGGTDGLVSIEDLVEEIVGEIADEHDVEQGPSLRALPNGNFVADARTELDDFQERTGIDLRVEDLSEEVDTLGGLAAALIGRLPQRGEIVPHPSGYEFEILEADPRRIKRVQIRPLGNAPDGAE
ncbi:MAG: hemolysin family protein [Rhizomicrobium sp.]|jgi:CBS domain containing-hemolysin-like protein